MAGCGATAGKDEGAQWKTYSTAAYEFDYPKSWVVGDPSEVKMPLPLEFVIRAPVPDDGFAANINMVIQTHPFLAPSAKEQADAAGDYAKFLGAASGMKEYKMIDFIPVKLGNIDAGVSMNEYTISQNSITVKNRQLIIPIGQKTYILTLTCRKEKWETYEPDFQKVIDSFKLK